MSTIVDEILLVHGSDDYDPVKAREYYLRTRELKGRQKGQQQVPSGRSSGSRPPTRSSGRASAQPQPNAARVKTITAQMLVLQASLAQLKRKLAELLEEAGLSKRKAKPEAKGGGKSGGSKTGTSDRKLSPQQKAEARKRAKDHYEKNKKPAAKTDGKKPSATERQEAVRQQIREVEARLRKMKAQIATLRTSSSVGARANHNK